MGKLLVIEDLVKKYGSLTAVDKLNMEVNEGELFAFVGPNGAGKSTTINILCTILEKTSGEVYIDGHKLDKENDAIRAKIGVVFQNSFLDDLLSVRENLESRASFYRLSRSETKSRISELTELTGLKEFINRPYGKLLGGQRRRADIARALLNQPKLLFLDEPTTGLDPQTRSKIWEAMLQLRKEKNVTIFMTTHYMEEAAGCDRVAILDHGILLADSTPMRLKDEYAPTLLRLMSPDIQNLKDKLSFMNQKYIITADTAEITLDHSLSAIPILDEIKPYIRSFEVVEGNMDTVFMRFTGKNIREAE